VLSLAVLAVSRLRRSRPSKLVVKERLRVEPVRVRSSLRDRIKITFDDQEVEELGQLKAEILNSGTEVIKNAVLRFQPPKGAEILDINVAPVDGVSSVFFDSERVEVSLDYINPVKEHNHRLMLSIILTGSAENMLVHGGPLQARWGRNRPRHGTEVW